MFESTTLQKMTQSNSEQTTLIQDIASGNPQALSRLYSVYGQRMYRYALRLCGDPAMAEDIVQESLLVVWQKAHRFRGEGRVIAWLLGIVHHKARKATRKRNPLNLEELTRPLLSTEPAPIDTISGKQESELIQAQLRSLTAPQQAVLELVFYQGLSLKETAAVCGCPVGTVKSRLNSAKQALRGSLERSGLVEEIK